MTAIVRHIRCNPGEEEEYVQQSRVLDRVVFNQLME